MSVHADVRHGESYGETTPERSCLAASDVAAFEIVAVRRIGQVRALDVAIG